MTPSSGKDLGNGWSMQFGQFKQPFGYEVISPYTKTLTVDRSAVAYAFAGGPYDGHSGDV